MQTVKLSLATAKYLIQPESHADKRYSASTEPSGNNKQLLGDDYEPLILNRPATFACIAMLNSGSANIAPEGLEAVMAFSSGDSLYISTALLEKSLYRY